MEARKVSILWSDGQITSIKSVNALRIAVRWLNTRDDVLMVHADGLVPQIYLKRR